MNVLGIMSGTSVDGVDYALCRIDARVCELLDLWSVAFPARLRERIRGAATGNASSHEIGQLHHDLGRFYATGARRKRLNRRIELIGLHGQTIFHNPHPKRPATLQIGEPAYLAEALRAPVVSNFRAADIAAGGQGAPLATAFHVRVFARAGRHVCVNNLGGISNVTSISSLCGSRHKEALTGNSALRLPPSALGTSLLTPVAAGVLAFDTGPANVLLDLAARHFSKGRLECDRNGHWAAKGRICELLVERWLRHPYFRKKPPKSTGRELFGEPFFAAALKEFRQRRLDRHDALATLTGFTARSIVFNYVQHLPSPPDEVVLCGGGAANPALVAALKRSFSRSLTRTRVTTSADHGWPLRSVEPSAFALLAWLRWQGQPGNLPQTTGARGPVLLGQVAAA